MKTVFLLMARYDGPRLNVDQIADFLGVSVARVRNMIYAHDLPFAAYKEGKQFYADINDVAEYHDGQVLKAKRERERLTAALAV